MTTRAYLKRAVSAFLAFAIIFGCIPAFEISLPSFASIVKDGTTLYEVKITVSNPYAADSGDRTGLEQGEIAGASVTVKDSAGNAVTVYDKDGNALTQPLTTGETGDAKGVVTFYVPNGTYAVEAIKTYSGSGYSYTYIASVEVKTENEDKEYSVTSKRYFTNTSVNNTYNRTNYFGHVDVRVSGELTTGGSVQNVVVGNARVNVVNPSNSSYNFSVDFSGDTEEDYEWKHQGRGVRIYKDAIVTVTCDITVTYKDENNQNQTRVIEDAVFVYQGEHAFKQAIYDCDGKQGLDFRIHADEIMELVYHNVTYVWKIAVPIIDQTTGEITGYDFIEMPGDLATVPTDDKEYATGEDHTIDTVWQKGDTIINEAKGEKYVFRGWAVYTTDADDHEQEFMIEDLEELNKLPITDDTIIYGVWVVEELEVIPGYITIEKAISGITDSSVLVNNLVFTIKDPDGIENQVSYSQFTDGKMKYYIGKEGKYVITETLGEVPGYEWTTVTKSYEVEVDFQYNTGTNAGTSAEYGKVTFTNTYTKKTGNPVSTWPTLHLAKMDTITLASLSGVQFELYNADGTVADLTTNEYGVVSYTFSKAGTYYLKEIATKDGYHLNEKVYTVKVEAGTPYEWYDASQDAYVTRTDYDVTVADEHFHGDENRLVVYNDKTGALAVEKEVAHSLGSSQTMTDKKFEITVDLGAALAGKTFPVSGYGSVEKLTADNSGKIVLNIVHGQTVVISGIPEGTKATVTEKDYIADGYKTPVFRENGEVGDGKDVEISRDTTAIVDVVNVYAPTYNELPATVVVGGDKNFTGRPGNAWLSTDSFTVKLQQWNGTAWVDVATKTMTASSKSYSFDLEALGIKYTAPGSYSYQVVEVIGSISGVTYDRTLHTFTVVVEDTGMGGANGLAITSVIADETDTAFAKSGNVWNKTDFDFNNTYSTSGNVAVNIDVQKFLENKGGSTMDLGKFSFVLTRTDASGYSETVYADNIGEARFFLTYDKAGTYVYTLKEVIPADAVNNVKDGIQYDPTVYTIRVEVADNNAGGLRATVYVNGTEFDTESELAFHNVYDPSDVIVTDSDPTSLPITIKKTLNGRTLKVGEFEFVLMQYNPATQKYDIEVAKAKNGANGYVNFNLTLNKVGQYYYQISEVVGDKGGITYEETLYYVAVIVTDNGKGQLVAEYRVQNLTNTNITFVNEYEAAPVSATIRGQKSLQDVHGAGRKLKAGEFTFHLHESDAEFKAVGRLVQSVTNAADGSILFNQGLSFTKTGTYYYVVKEVKGTELGVQYDESQYGVKIVVTDDGEGQLHASVSYVDGSIGFHNEYHTGHLSIAKEIDASVTADGYILNAQQKFTMIGRFIGLKAGEYNAVLENEGNVKVTVDRNGFFTVQLLAGQTIQFQNLPVGVVVELREDNIPAGYTPTYWVDGEQQDDTIVTTTVKDHAIASIIVMNDYEAKSVYPSNVAVNVEKILTGRDWQSGDEFTFKLQRWNGTAWEDVDAVAVKGSDASKAFTFEKMAEERFAKPGVYAYQILEVIPDTGKLPGVDYDQTLHTFTIVVGDAEMDGQLEILGVHSAHTDKQFSKVDGNWIVDVKFTNVYGMDDNATASVAIDILKNLQDASNSGVSKEGFKFGLYASEDDANNDRNALQYAFTDVAGEARFVIQYIANVDLNASEDQKTYFIKEVDTKIPGMQYDSDVEVVTVILNDNFDGTMSAKVKDEVVLPLQFSNTYNPDDATITPEIDKHLTGRDMVDGEFEFELYKLNTTTNKFEFVESKKNPAAVMENSVAKAKIQFSELSYAQVGQYYYKVVEKAGSKGGITYDPTVYYVIVTVTDNNGVLEASYLVDDMPNKEIVFHNEYDADDTQLFEPENNSTKFVPTISKVWNKGNGGKDTLIGGEFHFVLKQGDKLIGNGTNDATGNVEFIEAYPDAFLLTAAGQYEYTISEVIPQGAVDNLLNGITYDSKVFKLTVVVGENTEKGELYIESYSINGEGHKEIKFTNSYKADSVKTDLEGKKNYVGGALKGNDFTFILSGGNLTQPVKVQNDAEGKFSFKDLTFTEPGDYTFTIKEENGGKFLYGVDYDAKEYEVTVYVRDDGQGKLYVAGVFEKDAATRAALNLVFTNTYVKPADINVSIDINKVVENKGTAVKGPDGFQFQLKEYVWNEAKQAWEAGREALAVSDADGYAEFLLTFTEAHIDGKYKFEFSEIKGDLNDMKYDETVHTVEFSVVRNEKNELQAVVDGESVQSVKMSFTNVYTANVPYTGDSSNPMLWIALLFVTGGVLAVLTVDSKRKQKNQ